MKFTKTQSMGLAMALALLVSSVAQAGPADDYQAAWAQLKKLAGTWDSYLVGKEGREAVISYHVTGGSAVVFEEFIGDTPAGVRDMATAYHLDVDDLIATHYCGIGNQPRMRAVSYDPDARLLRFDFWDITHLPDQDEYYTTNIELYFEDDDNVELRFRGTSEGVQGDWMVHRLQRLTSRPYEKKSDDSE